jgi:tetratricopeptide (TPR) repeat protein
MLTKMRMLRKSVYLLLLFFFGAGLACTPYPRPARLPLSFLIAPAKPLIADRRFSEAVEILEEAAQIHPESAQPLITIGQIYLHQHRLLLAEDAFNRALARDLDNPVAMAGLANVLFSQNRLTEALEWWQRTVDRQPGLPGAFTGLGRTYLGRFEFDLAQEAFLQQQTHRFDPEAAWYLAALLAPIDLSAGRQHLASINSSPGEPVEFQPAAGLLSRRDYLRTTLAPFTEDTSQGEVAKVTGIALAQAELWPLAVHALTLAREKDGAQTADAETLAFLGHALAQAGRPALELFEEAQQADPTSALPLYFQGLYLRRQGALRAADDLFRRALDLDPQNTAIHIELAQTQIQQGDLAAAELWYLAAIEAADEEERRWVQHLLVQLYAERGYRMVEAGIPTAQTLLEADANDAQLYDWLGWMQFLSGQSADGEESLRRALELEPDLVSARYHLARLLETEGQTDLAAAEYRRVIDWDTSGHFRERALKDLQQL